MIDKKIPIVKKVNLNKYLYCIKYMFNYSL